MKQSGDIDDALARYADLVYRLAFARMGTKYDAARRFRRLRRMSSRSTR